MNYQNLKETVEKHFLNYPGIEHKSKYSVVNKGFPGTFNLSVSEPEMLDEFGNYLDYDKNLIYTKTQPVIRPNDFEEIVSKAADKKHLGMFEISAIAAVDTDKSNVTKHLSGIIDNFGKLLFEKLGLDPEKTHVKVCQGGKIKELTDGKYHFDKTIEKDKLSYNYWKKQGIPESNFISDKSRDSFLSLFIFGHPTPWGYRNEILYDIGEGKDEDSMLDIGTIEYLTWRPIFEGKEKTKASQTKGIKPWKHCVVVAGVGIERLLMAKNNYDSIMECSHIAPLYNKILEDAKNKDKKAAYSLTESIRTVHRILTDAQGYQNLDNNRRKKLNPYIQTMRSSLKKLSIPLKKIKDYLEVNAKTRSYYSELNNSELIAKEIGKIFERRFEQAPAWPQANFYQGTEGLKKAAEEILKEKGTRVDVIFSHKIMDFIPEFHRYFRKKRKENDIYLRVLSDRGGEVIERKEKDKEEHREIRFANTITRNLKSAIYIFENKIALINASEQERGGTIIENREIAKIMKKLFQRNWDKAGSSK